MRKSKMFALGLVVFMGLQLFMAIPFLPNQLVSADIDTWTLEDDFEERYYNNIYSQYENATATIDQSSTTFRPNAVGTYSELEDYGDTPNWECVDDVSPDDDTTYVATTSTVAVQRDTYNVPDHTTETQTIINVTFYVRAKKTGAGSDAYLIVYDNGLKIYQSIPINFAWNTYSYGYTLNPSDTEAWEWDDIDTLEIGIEMEYDGGHPRCTQVYMVVYHETDVSVSSTTTYKKQETSYYRAYGGLYSYLHNVTQNYTQHDILITHNSSIIINFLTLNIFPQALVFFLYFNCFYNISLFIGTEEYVLKTHDYSINDWKYIDIRLNRRDYLITDLNADFYIKIYPIENNNTHDVFYMDNLKVRYTDPEQAIDYNHNCVVGDQYNNFVSINATTSSFYAEGTGVNPNGWLDYYTTQAWRYETSSNAVISRGMKLANLWTLNQYDSVNDFLVYTKINMTIDKEYYLYEILHFIATGSAGKVSIGRQLFLYIDNALTYEMYNQTIMDKGFIYNYYELNYIIDLAQLNEKTMRYHSAFNNLYTNQTDWKPLFFPINEEIQSGLNVLQYEQLTHYTVDVESYSDPIIFQKVSREIHNTPLDDMMDVIDTTTGIGRLFRDIWDKMAVYFEMYLNGSAYAYIWQNDARNLELIEVLIERLTNLEEYIDDPNWIEEFWDDIQNIQDTYADGIVTTWRNLFGDNDFSGLESRFDERWGGLVSRGAKGGDSIFTRLFGRIFGEDVGLIPQLIFEFFNNFKNWIVIFFVMYIIMVMRSIMKRDYDKVRSEIGTFVSIIVFIVKLVQWLIGFVIRILTMIGGFIPFT